MLQVDLRSVPKFSACAPNIYSKFTVLLLKQLFWSPDKVSSFSVGVDIATRPLCAL